MNKVQQEFQNGLETLSAWLAFLRAQEAYWNEQLSRLQQQKRREEEKSQEEGAAPAAAETETEDPWL
jgi:hypothetical protein